LPAGSVPTLAEELVEDALERFLRYVRIDTQSAVDSDSYPSTDKQLDLLRLLRDELAGLGLADAALDEHGYVTATLASTAGRTAPTIALFAHVDTTPEVTGANVNPRRVRYEGGEIPLAGGGTAISPSEFPDLGEHLGHVLITTDGSTLLGADDKAGVAEIMAAAAYLAAHPEVPHGPLKVVFNPDEEVARGVIHLPVRALGAVAAYTVDGLEAGEVADECFFAAQVRMRIRGRGIHTGSAKGGLVNAIKLAAAIVERLPKDTLSPETTDGREGFVHPLAVSGDPNEVELRFNVRDFEEDLLDGHVEHLRRLAAQVAATDPRSSIEIDVHSQYRNMREALRRQPRIVENLERAIRRVGLEPHASAIRGGTDGSLLTEMGLPAPNVFTGCHGAHSEREWICVDDMGLAAATIVELARIWAEEPSEP
jgi:tripeptide aminopeptidase